MTHKLFDSAFVNLLDLDAEPTDEAQHEVEASRLQLPMRGCLAAAH